MQARIRAGWRFKNDGGFGGVVALIRGRLFAVIAYPESIKNKGPQAHNSEMPYQINVINMACRNWEISYTLASYGLLAWRWVSEFDGVVAK